jgi:protein-disulfide isomerase
VGAQPLGKFTAIIDEELLKTEALVVQGIRPSSIYDHLQTTATSAPPPEKKTIPAPTAQNPSRGPANAKVVVQLFSDLQCTYCAHVQSTVDELEKAYPHQVRVVWRNLPLSMHAEAEPAAEAAMEAYHQKGNAAFWAMVELLYAAQGQPGALGRASLVGYAAQLGLDSGAFADALDTHAHKALIDADTKVANDAQITGTPSFVINGYFVSGAQPLTKLKKLVKMALGR